MAILKYRQHPSVARIKSKHKAIQTFDLHKVTRDTVIKEIVDLNPRKAVSGKIPIKALKAAMYECADSLTDIFNYYIVELWSFPDELKLAEIVPAHTKKSTTEKSNYRSISLLPVVSKVFERIIIKQIQPFVDSILSKYL